MSADAWRLLSFAHRGGQRLEAAARGKIADFIRSRQTEKGGFADRSGTCDIYYTFFGLSTLAALGISVRDARVDTYLNGFQPENLVDWNSLINCRKLRWYMRLPRLLRGLSWGKESGYASRFQTFLASADTSAFPQNDSTAPYSVFLSSGTLEACGLKARPFHLDDYRCAGGGFANVKGGDAMLNATVCAAHLLNNPGACGLILRCRNADGGFGAFEGAPSDLLSTATALFTLRRFGLKVPLGGLRGFIHDCWRADGGFSASPECEIPDCEYTFYALLTGGSLG